MEGPLQLLFALLLAAASAWAITVLGGSLERATSAIAELVGGWRPDPWPRGVQEEDRDRPWFGWPRHWSASADVAIEDASGAVPTGRVRSRTRIR